MSYERQITVRKNDKRLLAALKEMPAMIERAERLGVIDDADRKDDLSYDQLLRTLIPADVEPIEASDEERIYVTDYGGKERVRNATGGERIEEREVLLSFATRAVTEELGDPPPWAFNHEPNPDELPDN